MLQNNDLLLCRYYCILMMKPFRDNMMKLIIFLYDDT
jgi:hypothetical protein